MSSQNASNKKSSVAELEATISSLREENEQLQKQNAKLHKDCVAFAKKLKKINDSGILDVDVVALQEDNKNMYAAMQQMQEQINSLNANLEDQQSSSVKNRFRPKRFFRTEVVEEYDEDDDGESPLEEADNTLTTSTDIYSYEEAIEEPIAEDFSTQDDFEEESEEELEEVKAIKAPVPTVGKTVARTIIGFLLVLVILNGLISLVTALFAHNFTDATLFGHRFYTVVNDSMDPEITMDDIVWVKKNSIKEVKANDVILNDARSRSFATVTEVKNDYGMLVLTVQDNSGTYEVDSSHYLGKASNKVVSIGKLVRYGCNHTYNYFAFHIAAILILVALLLFIPSGTMKIKKKKLTENDLTI